MAKGKPTHTSTAIMEEETVEQEAREMTPDGGSEPLIVPGTFQPRAGVSPLAAPPPFGSVPTSINQILFNAGAQATRFTGPVVSAPIGQGMVPGLMTLALPISLDYSMGSFSLPMQFPPQSILLWAVSMVYATFAGSVGPTDTTFQLGTGNGRNDILTADGMGPIHTTSIHPVIGTLPFPQDPNPGQCWLTVNGQGNTSGSGLILLVYVRSAANWN